MHLRRQGDVKQVFMYRGYNKEKKQALQVLVGSLNYSNFFKPSKKNPPTEEEMKEIQTYIDEERKKTTESNEKWVAGNLQNSLKRFKELLEGKPELIGQVDIAGVMGSLDEVKAFLKPHFKRPAKTKDGKTVKKKPATKAKKKSVKKKPTKKKPRRR